jgi:uncharacterized protein YdhG (YjbR/CyaY superfamily)
MKSKQKTTKSAATGKRYEGFSEEERAAMRDAVREQRAGKTDGESDVLEKIAGMTGSDRAMAERLHEIIKAADSEISPKTWYGMPAYAKGGSTICFFKPAQKFKTRYATLGFSDKAKLDDGEMWPTEYALARLGAAEEERIVALVKKAVR